MSIVSLTCILFVLTLLVTVDSVKMYVEIDDELVGETIRECVYEGSVRIKLVCGG